LYFQRHTSCALAAKWARSLFFNNIPVLPEHLLKLLRWCLSWRRRFNSLSRWADCRARCWRPPHTEHMPCCLVL
jgi:hypothetical protein